MTGMIEALLAGATRHPDRCALELLDGPQAGKDRWTFADLLAHSERYQHAFDSMAIQPGDGVMVLLPSGPELVACMYASVSAGAVFCPVNTGLTAHELSLLLADFRPAAVVCTAPLQQHYAAALVSARVLLADSLGEGRREITPPAGNPVVSCHYTYKGIGRPLGVEHRYHDYTACITSMIEAYPGVRNGSHFVGLPVYAIYGLTSALLAPLFLGGRIVLTQKSFEIDPIEVLENHQIRFACVVPFLLRRFLSKARRRNEQGLPLRLHPELELVCGGSQLPADLAEEARRVLGVTVYEGYGTTETLPVSGTSPGRHKPGSIGVPFSRDVEVRVVGPDWSERPPEAAGQIAVRGPGVIGGFRGAPADTTALFHNGWFNTGDLGYKDRDGYLYFTGRSAAFTKVASQMVDVAEVESVLRRHAGVADARVTVRRRAELGEVLAASVIPKDGVELTERELKAHCKKLISSHKVPRDFRFCQR